MAMIYTNEMMEKDLKKYQEKMDAMDARVAQMNLVHEDLIIVERIEDEKLMTPLYLDEKAKAMRIHSSFYGRLIEWSRINTGDPVQEEKRSLLKKNQILSFNPDSAYSLNITNYPEVWVIGLNNILVIDHGYNPMEMTRAMLEKRVSMSAS